MLKHKTLTSLHDAIRSGNVKLVETLLSRGVDVNGQNAKDECRSALHVAVKNDNAEMIKLLLSKGAKVDLKDKNGKSALNHALFEGKLEIADILIDAGGDVNDQDNEGFTALTTAIMDNKHEYTTDGVLLVEEILARGADVNIKKYDGITALMLSAFSRDKKIFECLIDAGADVNCIGKDWGAFHLAACNNNVEMVTGLLSRVINKADINIKTDKGETALHIVIKFDNLGMADFLIEAGIDVNCRDNFQGFTALHLLAMKTNSAFLVKKLISRKVDVHSKDDDGVSVLSLALIHGALEVADLLIEAGANVNDQNNEGNTVLNIISNSENRKHITDGVELTKELLSRGVDPNIPNSHGETALHSAYHNDDFDMAKYLTNAGADINHQDNEGLTVLQYAVHHNRVEMVKHLLSRGADANVKNDQGDTALHVAIHEGHFEIADLLIEAGTDVNCRDSSHDLTALHMLALSTNDVSLVQKLLSRGARVDIIDFHGMTALSHALIRGALKVADLLIKAGGDVNSRDEEGGTALHLMIDNSRRKYITNGVTLANALITRGVDVSLKNFQGETALNLAFTHGEFKMAKSLIDAGANVNYQDEDGNTILHLTVLNGDVSLIQLLLSFGADINVKNKEGNTALHVATMDKKIEVVKELLSQDPDKSIKNERGNTAFEIAVIDSNCHFLAEHCTITAENTYFQDATFSKRHMNDIRKTPHFKYLKSLGIDADLNNLDNHAPMHSVSSHNVNNLNKKVTKMSLKNRGNARVKSEPRDSMTLFNFEKLSDDELLMLFFKN